jgi:transcriptional regulator with XRE-family HTH domain
MKTLAKDLSEKVKVGMPMLTSKITIEDLPRALRSVRQKRKLTLKEVESQTGLSISTISRIENGSIMPTAETFVTLLKWLKLTPELEVAMEHTGDTLTEIGLILKRDPRLSVEARDKLLRAWRPMYELYVEDEVV